MLTKSLLSLSRLHSVTTTYRLASSYYGLQNVALTDDGSTFVAWHPKQDFPYEYTKPLPIPEAIEDNTVLKTQLTAEVLEVFKKKNEEVARQELMNITGTTKHRWFRRPRDKRAQKTEMNREYLWIGYYVINLFVHW